MMINIVKMKIASRVVAITDGHRETCPCAANVSEIGTAVILVGARFARSACAI
jgi:hypothetical protein